VVRDDPRLRGDVNLDARRDDRRREAGARFPEYATSGCRVRPGLAAGDRDRRGHRLVLIAACVVSSSFVPVSMAVSEQELSTLAASHDIITLGMIADEARQARHGKRTTFVRVADVKAEPGADATRPPAAGEVRIVGTPADREAAIARVTEVAAAAQGCPVSGFSLAD